MKSDKFVILLDGKKYVSKDGMLTTEIKDALRVPSNVAHAACSHWNIDYPSVRYTYVFIL
jgi:hypothetical protein